MQKVAKLFRILLLSLLLSKVAKTTYNDTAVPCTVDETEYKRAAIENVQVQDGCS